jgi:TPP-dependent 2-oxoacid decarboxylase
MPTEVTVAEYQLTRLKEVGLDHLFCVPGDSVLAFFNQVLKSDPEYVGTCNELNAAYAADGYAFLINNDGYTIKRVICDRPDSDIPPWQYHKLVDVFGGGLGFDVHSEGELEETPDTAATADGLVFTKSMQGAWTVPMPFAVQGCR